MNRNYKRQTVILFCQDSAEVAVPRVTMHEVGVDVHGVEIRTASNRAKSRPQRFWTGEICRVQFEADDLEIALLGTLIAKAAHFDRNGLCKLLRQITDMHAGAAI